MNSDSIKEYWQQRAETDSSAQSTTQDYFLRQIECDVLKERIISYRPFTVLDVGCGDAYTTVKLAVEFQDINFRGVDYAEAMVLNARNNIKKTKLTNLIVSTHNACAPFNKSFDIIYSTRCLINLPSWELQQIALQNIANALKENGIYVMIENFIEGHIQFNKVREVFGLSTIPVRNHNMFFQHADLLNFVSKRFEILEDINISSSYYLVSRVIYTKICKENGTQPDYFNEHHKYAAQLPFCGEYGPVRMICMRKK